MTQPTTATAPVWWCRTFGHRIVHQRLAPTADEWFRMVPGRLVLTYCARCGLIVSDKRP